jgi:hypothetical protein
MLPAPLALPPRGSYAEFVYAACLFCHASLGRNEALEHFPVGRRLAYDAGTGRLWVVCRRCERWNLTPLEQRWEAIEEAERAFRGTRVRVATDQIGLARVPEGTELVRIGAPPRLELATWRYGDQFGRRRRKHIAWTGAGVTLSMAFFGTIVAGPATGAAAIVMATIPWLHFAQNMVDWRRTRRASRVRTVPVPDGEGGRLDVTEDDAQATELVRIAEINDWRVIVRQTELPLPRQGAAYAKHRKVTLAGDDAQRALATVLPHVNRTGGSARLVSAAVEVIAGVPGVPQLLTAAAALQKNRVVPNHVGGLPAPVRLALEMALHEEDERRAMEGELAALEARWREAEEIARIADSLALPREAEVRLEEMRRGIGT